MISRPIVLASGSPYRRALLARLGIAFSCRAPDIDESARTNESARELCARLSRAKADAVARTFTDALVIASDQVAVANDTLFSKPGDHAGAVAQLRALSAQTCLFHTGLHVLNVTTGRRQHSTETVEVRFRKLALVEIESYLQFDQPYDCAGSFKSEAGGIALLEWMRGDDPNALIGLPLIRLAQMLRNEEVPLFGATDAEAAEQ